MGFDPERKGVEAASSSGAGQHLEPQTQSQPGPFVLRTLLDHVPLSEDGEEDSTKINCVDYLGTISDIQEHCIFTR